MERRAFLNGIAGMGAAYSMGAFDPVQFYPKPSNVFVSGRKAARNASACGST
jgi:hypothetical protein